jgi:hypothetical protein
MLNIVVATQGSGIPGTQYQFVMTDLVQLNEFCPKGIIQILVSGYPHQITQRRIPSIPDFRTVNEQAACQSQLHGRGTERAAPKRTSKEIGIMSPEFKM